MTTIRIALALGLGLTVAACSKEDKPADKTPAKKVKAPADKAPAKPAPADPAAVSAAVDAVMAPYEECRALLAADKSEGVTACAKAMAAAATSGKAAVGDGAKPHMEAVAAAATKLAGTAADDIDALRLAYGEVSKPVVAVLTASPAAAKKYHVFECPMAEGYKRWAQPNAELANPYMGSKMLACGSEVHDHHQGMKADDHAGHDMKHN